MKTVKSKTMAKRGEEEGHFKGVIFFIDENGKEKKFDWICIEPDGSDVHLDLILDKKNFLSIHEAPTPEKFLALTPKQKIVLVLAVKTIPDTILNALPISHELTKEAEAFGAKFSGSHECSFEIGENEYNEIFS